jgi:hypothetical protein
VASVQNTNQWTKAGVMMRESTAANSSRVDVIVSPSKGVGDAVPRRERRRVVKATVVESGT